MHYNNSTGKDGVFVVEVSRGADSQQIPESPLSETAATFIQTLNTNASTSAAIQNSLMEKNEKSPSPIQEEVQVHEPPRDIEEIKKLNQIPEVEEDHTEIQRSNTGLSQSDLSSSSCSSSHSNQAYTYGKQTLYNEVDLTVNAQGNSKVIKLQNETTPIKVAAESKGNDDAAVQSNIAEDIQKETNANEATEMDNKLQMQMTTEPAVEPKDVVVMARNLDIINASDNVTEEAAEIITLEHAEIIEKLKNIEKSINNGVVLQPVFDNLMSLPEPPSYEEIKQISDNTAGDSTQLDSLPPPPPPPLFVVDIDKDDKVANVEHAIVENDEASQQHALNNIKIVPPPPSCTTAEIELNNGKQLLSSQLTPPESPPANCANNRGHAGIHLPLSAMAVNVNGS